MSKIFAAADFHFYHDNIIKYCERPFKDSREMNEALIRNWNSVVNHEDVIWVLGDFSLSKDQIAINRILERLNGQKNLIIGNHDSNACVHSHHWNSVHELHDIVIEKQMIVLSHYAMRIWNGSHRGSWCLYGHSHSAAVEENNFSFDIGVDAWNYTPVSFEQIKRKMEDKKSAIIVGEKGNKNVRQEIQEKNKKYWL